jgi:hypothetical protein
MGVEAFDIEEAGEEGLALLALAVPEQLVDEALAGAAAVDEHVLERGELFEMRAHGEVRPARVLAHLAPREAHVRAVQALRLGALGHQAVEEAEKAPRLRRQLVERAAEHLVRQAVGRRDVVARHLDVADGAAVVLRGLHLALVLVE